MILKMSRREGQGSYELNQGYLFFFFVYFNYIHGMAWHISVTIRCWAFLVRPPFAASFLVFY